MQEKRLYRSRRNRMLFGVAGGLADYTGIDATVVRLVFVLGSLLGFGSFLVIYLVMIFVVPEEPVGAGWTSTTQSGANVYQEPTSSTEETPPPPQEP